MEERNKLLGTSQVSSKLRISIIKRASEKLDVKDGDLIGFYEDEKGRIFLKKE
jgi:bifunctional DNA-binding transcriptional regulator/antitoxin component of YhaV-PrlF toxin-antitoxin module